MNSSCTQRAVEIWYLICDLNLRSFLTSISHHPAITHSNPTHTSTTHTTTTVTVYMDDNTLNVIFTQPSWTRLDLSGYWYWPLTLKLQVQQGQGFKRTTSTLNPVSSRGCCGTADLQPRALFPSQSKTRVPCVAADTSETHRYTFNSQFCTSCTKTTLPF